MSQNEQTSSKLVLFLQHFLTKDGEERQKELDDALLENIRNPYVTRVYHLSENDTSANYVANIRKTLTEDLQKKLEIIKINKWLFYSDAMEAATSKLKKNLENLIFCIINSDCYLDKRSKWDDLCNFLKTNPKKVVCQSRVEKPDTETETPQLDPKFNRLAGGNTQDAWFFNFKTLSSLPKTQIDEKFSFALGRLGCDNLIAYRLNEIGFKVINFGTRYWVVHNDKVRKGARSYVPVDMTKVGSRLVPDFDRCVEMDGVKFLSGLGIPMDDSMRLSIKIAYYAVLKKRMNTDEKLTMVDLLKRFSHEELYKVCCQILNGYVKINNY